MAYNPARAAAAVARVIDRYGMLVSINGGAAVKAIVDERPEVIARSIPQDLFDSLDGRPAFFHFKPAQAPKANDKLAYDGQTWQVHPVRVAAVAGMELLTTVLATSGAR